MAVLLRHQQAGEEHTLRVIRRPTSGLPRKGGFQVMHVKMLVCERKHVSGAPLLTSPSSMFSGLE